MLANLKCMNECKLFHIYLNFLILQSSPTTHSSACKTLLCLFEQMNHLIWHKSEWTYWTLQISPTVFHLLSTDKRDIQHLTAPFIKASVFLTFLQWITKYTFSSYSTLTHKQPAFAKHRNSVFHNLLNEEVISGSKLKRWHACLNLFSFLCKYFTSTKHTQHFHTLVPVWFEETICKEIFAIFRANRLH